MIKPSGVPAFDDTILSGDPLAEFATDLRAWVFSSAARAAAHFGLARTTIWRYETGHHPPPMGYLAALIELIAERMVDSHVSPEMARSSLLDSLNAAIRARYPDEQLLLSWDALTRHVADYRTRGMSTPASVAATALCSSVHIDWGEAPDTSIFYGRNDAVLTLRGWLLEDRCRLVGIVGMGGMGKSTLAARLTEQVAPLFAMVFWRSLINAPSLEHLLQECLTFLAQQQGYHLPDTLDTRLRLLLHHLQQQRCLLVLDNVEAILQGGERTGGYRAGYEGYGILLRLLGETRHQSCLLLISREKPCDLAALTAAVRTSPLVKVARLPGITTADTRALLVAMGLDADDATMRALAARCSGNPGFLEMVAMSIRDTYAGNIAAFLAHETVVFNDVRTILQQQFSRLSPAEQEVLFWLVVLRERCTVADVRDLLLDPAAGQHVLETLQSLCNRSLVEHDGASFFLHNVVLEFLSHVLVERVSQDLLSGSVQFINRHALLLAQAHQDVREKQACMLLAPVIRRLLARLGYSGCLDLLAELLAEVRYTQAHTPGYAAGVLLNLLVYLRADLRGIDCAHLCVWQAYLAEVDLCHTSFADADLRHSVLPDVCETMPTLCACSGLPSHQAHPGSHRR